MFALLAGMLIFKTIKNYMVRNTSLPSSSITSCFAQLKIAGIIDSGSIKTKWIQWTNFFWGLASLVWCAPWFRLIKINCTKKP